MHYENETPVTLPDDLTNLWTHVSTTLKRVGWQLITLVRTGINRVHNRWQHDSSFRRTVSLAINAITVTALESPAVATAVEAFLADRTRRSTLSYASDEEDEFDSYPRSSRLWDSLN